MGRWARAGFIRRLGQPPSVGGDRVSVGREAFAHGEVVWARTRPVLARLPTPSARDLTLRRADIATRGRIRHFGRFSQRGVLCVGLNSLKIHMAGYGCIYGWIGGRSPRNGRDLYGSKRSAAHDSVRVYRLASADDQSAQLDELLTRRGVVRETKFA